MAVDVPKSPSDFLWRPGRTRSPLPIAFRISRSAASLLGLWIAVCIELLVHDWSLASAGFGDSDDAMRLVLVRELVSGRGWYDQRVLRIEPPDGVWLHWSRLLDGALAAPLWALRQLLGAAQAEFWLTLLWPLTLILPLFCAARSLIGQFNPDPQQRSAAEATAAVMALACLPLYAQFHPGRIDHHNVQILLWLIAFAGAASSGGESNGDTGFRSAAMAGGAIGLGLAIGLEAIVFEAAIAAFMAVRMLLRPQAAPAVRAFALALAGVLLVAFLAQTPPLRWGASVCDALGLNLTLGVVVGCGLLVVASFVRGRLIRLALTTTAAAAGVGACLALDPVCVRGPFAQVDPRIFGIWLDGVQETLSIPRLLRTDIATGLTLLIAAIWAGVAWAALSAWDDVRRRPAYVLTGLMLAIAAASTWGMLRMSSYLMWAAIPAGATLAARLAVKLSPSAPPPRVRLCLFGLILAPNLPAALAVTAMKLRPGPVPVVKAAGAAANGCFRPEAYQQLARLPPGLAVGETDLGAFVLVYTPSTVLAAPYHRDDKGILAAQAIFAAPVNRSRGLAAQAGATYVVTCRNHRVLSDQTFGPTSLGAVLEAGRTPNWLKRLSPISSTIQVFGVRP